jgi:hypothetical protein
MPWVERLTTQCGLKGRETVGPVLEGAAVVKFSRPFRPQGWGALYPPGYRPPASTLGRGLPARWAGSTHERRQYQEVGLAHDKPLPLLPVRGRAMGEEGRGDEGPTVRPAGHLTRRDDLPGDSFRSDRRRRFGDAPRVPRGRLYIGGRGSLRRALIAATTSPSSPGGRGGGWEKRDGVMRGHGGAANGRRRRLDGQVHPLN